jgi:hypothetical protein
MVATITAVLLALVLAASHAEAACAWVLWEVPATIDPKKPIALADARFSSARWTPSRAFDTASACDAALNEANREEWRAMGERNKSGAALWDTYVYRCLPDTIDPRGAKGGGR